MYKVLMTAPTLHPAATQLLQTHGIEALFLASDRAEEIDAILRTRQVDAIIARTHAISRQTIEQAPALKIIARHGAGYDNIALDAATERGIPVTIAPGTNARSVAELALGLMFALARRITTASTEVKRGQWNRKLAGCELRGKTLGVVGFGRIGRELAAMARALGMETRMFDPHAPADPHTPACPSLEALVAQADFVSLHCPALPDNAALVDAALLQHFRPGAILINTSRGSLVDETALHAAILAGHIGGAGLDTLAVEPVQPGNPLLALDAVVLTPHVGGNTSDALEQTALSAARSVIDFLLHGRVDDAVLVNQAYTGEPS